MEVFSLPGNVIAPKVMRIGSKHSLSGSLGALMRVSSFMNHWSSLYSREGHPRSEKYCQLSLSFTFTCIHSVYVGAHKNHGQRPLPTVIIHVLQDVPTYLQSFLSSGPLLNLLSSGLRANSYEHIAALDDRTATILPSLRITLNPT